MLRAWLLRAWLLRSMVASQHGLDRRSLGAGVGAAKKNNSESLQNYGENEQTPSSHRTLCKRQSELTGLLHRQDEIKAEA